jgi:hypothetical protein
MRAGRSGSSLIANRPRLLRGTRPKCTTSGSAKVRRRVAALIGSMSPMRSAIEVSGVASFSW